MIDFRHKTFLALTEIKNYTKTAEYLHLTQPAVTQHINYLEDLYNCKLFVYENRKLILTNQAIELKKLLIKIQSDTNHFMRNINNSNTIVEDIKFGSTLSIGEYVMPDIITKILANKPNLNIHMEVNNTKVLLEKLEKGEIDFAILEGFFDKNKYHSIIFSIENFIGVCSSRNQLFNKKAELKDLLDSSLIIREQGSGTREILENILNQYNYTFNSFKNIIEIGNMNTIKHLVANDIGISFLYEVVAKTEILKGTLAKINIFEINIKREFNFVFLKDSFYKNKYLKYYSMMKDAYK